MQCIGMLIYDMTDQISSRRQQCVSVDEPRRAISREIGHEVLLRVDPKVAR